MRTTALRIGTCEGGTRGARTVAPTTRFTIKNALLYAYADAGDDGHTIEVNSSGGPHAPNTYTVEITGNAFRGVTGQRDNSNDEAVQHETNISRSFPMIRRPRTSTRLDQPVGS